jgi:SAM-dependent methyltransferase
LSRPGSPFDDAVLYDWEYRRRRDDVRFYQTLAGERGGPVLDLGCGTGRLMLPLLRDGHVVVGLDRAAPMLARAAARLGRLGPAAQRRALLVRGDLRTLPLARRRFGFAVAAFHTVQHCESDAELVRFFRAVAAALVPGGWLAFDTFAPTRRFIERRGPSGTTRFRHPRTGRPTIYSESHRLDGRVLAMTFRYQTVAAESRGAPRPRTVELRHRLLQAGEIEALLARAGLGLIASWGGFDGRPLEPDDESGEQHVYLARNPQRASKRASKRADKRTSKGRPGPTRRDATVRNDLKNKRPRAIPVGKPT